jgi:hypothetical protein
MTEARSLEIPYDAYPSPAAPPPPSPAPTTADTSAPSEPTATSQSSEPESSGPAISARVFAESTAEPVLEHGDGAHVGNVLQISLNGIDTTSGSTALLNVETGGGSPVADALLSVDADAEGGTAGGETEGALIGKLSLANFAIGGLLDDGAATSSPAQSSCTDGHDANLVQIGLGDSAAQVAGATSVAAPTQAEGSAALLSIQSDAAGAEGAFLGNLLALRGVSMETGGGAEAGGTAETGDLQMQHLLCGVGEQVDHLLGA